MKQFIYLILFALLQVCVACGNTEENLLVEGTQSFTDLDNQLVSSVGFSNDTVPILKFTNHEEFEKNLCHLRSLTSSDEKEEWVHNTFPGFFSIRDIYEQAGEEAAEINLETEKSYMSFMAKYHNLFFPLEDEDAGFYIPIKDENITYLANPDCKISIGDEVVDVKDILDYSDLQEAGMAYYESSVATVASSEITFGIPNPNVDPVEPEYDSGWTEYNKHKVKLKARRLLKEIQLSPGFYGSESYFHTEFCFRKKSFLGWINYRCESTITGEITIPLFNKLRIESNHSGTSSHDKEYLYPIHISTDSYYKYYRYHEAPCKVTVVFNDIATPLYYSWTMPALVFKLSLSSMVHPIVIPSN